MWEAVMGLAENKYVCSRILRERFTLEIRDGQSGVKPTAESYI